MFSKLEADKMLVEVGAFDARALVRDVLTMVEPLARENGNRLSVELPAEPIRMRSDAVKVRQSLLNVLGNACKFTSNGSVEVRARVTSVGDIEFVEFVVEDTGIGMTENELGKIFEPFVQADSSMTRRYGGTGLGLSITQRFCAMLGGRVEAASTRGQGSRFTILLPRALSR
jgi:signal transduction histidine kinase